MVNVPEPIADLGRGLVVIALSAVLIAMNAFGFWVALKLFGAI